MTIPVDFWQGVESNEIVFNQQLAEVIKEAFYKYLDSTARLDPNQTTSHVRMGANRCGQGTPIPY